MATTILTGTSVSSSLASTGSLGRLNFGGSGGDTFIQESATDIMDFYVGGDIMLRLDETNNLVHIPQDAANATFMMGDTQTWEQYVSGDDVIARNKVTGGVIKLITDNSTENLRLAVCETTFNEGSADINFRI